MMIIWILFILAVGISILLYNAVKSYRWVYRLTHPVRYTQQTNTKAFYTYKKFTFQTKDGITLAGIDYCPKIACIGTVLVCHFLGGSKEAILMFVDFLLMHGYRVLCYDNRNHGESETAESVKATLDQDFSAFYKTIQEMGIKGPFGIMGFSMGASVALRAMQKYPDICAAVTDSGPMMHAKNYFRYVLNNKKIRNPLQRILFLCIFLYYAGFAKMERQTHRTLKQLKGKPVLMIHGKKDTIISPDNPCFAYSLLKSPNAALWLVPRARHLMNRFNKPTEYVERILAFLGKNIATKMHDEENSADLTQRKCLWKE
ncbi:MAG: alpha/beta hydrolase [Clostridiales bacterium]|nr:alpha/beta hydrolase [Clostridiales bacterium]